MRSLARWGSLPLVAMPLNSWALGLGEIESNSFLNQPLNAEIALSATAEELATLRVSLAPVDAFLEQGLEYPSFLTSVEFEVTQNSAGENVIIVTSTQAIAEPFVTFLVRVSHARGGFTREYSVLLDPPLFLPPVAQAPQIAEPVVLEPPSNVAGGPIPREPEAPAPEVQAATAPEPRFQPEPALPSAAADGSSYTVQGGDTLWAIAGAYRPAGVSRNQAMMSIFEANPGAFNGNINRLRRGAILRIPPAAELGAMSTASATAEVQRQIDIWRNAVEATPELVLLPPSEGAFSGGAVSGGADSAAASALEGRVTNLQAALDASEAELTETRRLLELRSEELADLQRQLDDGSATEVAPAPGDALSAEDPLEGLESEPLFVDDLEPAADVTDEQAEPSTTAAEPEASAATNVPPVVFEEPAPSIIDRVIGFLSQPIVFIAGGVLAVLLAGLAFLKRRRDRADDVTGQWQQLETEMDEESDLSSTARLGQLDEEADMVVVEGSDGSMVDTDTDFGATAAIDAIGSDFDELDSMPGTEAIEALTDADFDNDDELAGAAEDDFEPEPADQTLSSQTIINLDQADPIAEADFHMAYGLYDQAADLIAKALEAEPDNREFKLKLLEVYFVWGNREEFLATATGLREEIGQGGNADWDKVVIMGKQICPDEPLFSEATAGAAEVDLALEASGITAGLDFAFEDEGEDVDLDFGIVEDDDMSLEESGAAAAAAVVSDDFADEAGEFLDIGERTQAGLKAAFFEEEDDQDAPDLDDVDIESAIPSAETEDAELELEDADEDLDIEDLDSTQEARVAFGGDDEDYLDAPTLEAPTVEADMGAPTLQAPAMDDATLEAPAFEADALDDDELEGIETIEVEDEDVENEAVAVEEMSSVRLAAGGGGSDMTAEIEIDDLGFDVGDLGEFDDLSLSDETGGTQELSDFPLEDSDYDDGQLSATGVTKVLDPPDDGIDEPYAGTGTEIGDDDATVMAPGFDVEVTGTRTEVLEQPPGNFDPAEPAVAGDLNFDDFSSALEGAETVERPAAASYGGAAVAAGAGSNAAADQTSTTQIGPIDPQAMSEVGTKLDLARAYIDMGDPEGARSILEEVLTEGNDSQKSEAQSLMDALPG